MTRTTIIDSSREIALGTAYWLVFLAALSPENLVRAADWNLELARVIGASLLAGLATPFVMSLVRRYPVEADRLWRRVLLHSASAMAIAFALIAASCVLAPIAGVGDTRPFFVALPDQVRANWLIVGFSLMALTGIAHAVRYQSELLTQPKLTTAATLYLSDITIGSRGRVISIELASVDWIETQGNYLALHEGAKTHLLRETLAALEPKLNPQQFVRIHRRILVAADRVREIAPLANGDGLVRLTDGTELRLSRNHRKRLHDAVRIP